jgi:RNA-binding protein Luc7-like 2
MDEIRKQLDSLMGQHRDVPLDQRDKIVRKRHFSDHTVCKYYLCGFCPYDEFRKTKNDLGSCPKQHDDGCVAEWDNISDRDKERYGYERDLMRRLDRMRKDLEKQIEVNKAQIERSAALREKLEKEAYTPEEQRSLDAMARDIESMLVQAQILGEQGDVDAAEGLVERAEGLREQRHAIKKAVEGRIGANSIAGVVQTVCPVSGLIVKGDGEGDHKSGRNYTAWKRLHETYSNLDSLFQRRREQHLIGAGESREALPPNAMVEDDSEEEEGQVS